MSDLFDSVDPIVAAYEARKLARRTDPETSHKAAAKVAPKLSERRREVLEVISCGQLYGDECFWVVVPITSGEAARAYVKRYPNRPIQAAANTPSKRIPELLKMGLIRVAGERKCSDSGYDCQTYEITAEGREALK